MLAAPPAGCWVAGVPPRGRSTCAAPQVSLCAVEPAHLHPRSFFLPPIIFYAGLSVKKKHFFRNFFTIAGYGIAGTYACFAFISLGLYLCLRSYLTFGVSRRGRVGRDACAAGSAAHCSMHGRQALPPRSCLLPTPPARPPPARLQDCLALGSILAATDSVAALQVISQDSYPLLYSLVFGEGVINDATSIVILGTIQARAAAAVGGRAGGAGRVTVVFSSFFVGSWAGKGRALHGCPCGDARALPLLPCSRRSLGWTAPRT